MKKIQYKLTTFAPILISSNAGSTFSMETLLTIPGRTILGAFASMFIRHHSNIGDKAHKNNLFASWFLNGDLKFSQAIPLIISDKKNTFKGEKVPFCIKIKKQDNTIINLFESSYSDKTKFIDKFTIKIPNKKNENFFLKKDSVKTKINLHHARDREKGSAKEGDFFAYESLCPNLEFSFDIIGKKENLKSFMGFFACFNKPDGYKISLGKSRTAGYGACKVKLLTSNNEPKEIILNSDIDKAISNKCEIIGVLNSPAIILNEQGIPETSLNCLEKALGLKISKTTDNNFAILKQEINEKFTSVWGFKTPSEPALSAGSCFKIMINPDNINIRDKIIFLITNGIGERTHEGFGSISFIPMDKYKTIENIIPSINTEKINKPENTPPDILKMITRIYINHLIDKQITKALNDSSKFFNGVFISSSLCSRLENFSINKKLENELKILKMDKEKTKASMSLKGFYNNESNLLKHLLKQDKELNDINKQIADNKDKNILFPKLKKCRLELELIDVQTLENFFKEKELFKVYMTTFFSSMRKRIIKEEKNNE